MKEKIIKTEMLDVEYDYIEKLSDMNAFDFMISNQKKAFDSIKNNKNQIIKIIDILTKKLSKDKKSRLIYVGAGTSGRIGVQDGVELMPTFGWPKSRLAYLMAGGRKALLESVEGAEDNEKEAKKDVENYRISCADIVLGVSASGDTPYTNKVLKEAKKCGALTIGISNNKDAKIKFNTDINVILDTGPEVIAGSTRLTAGTSQKICLNIISTLVMTKLGKVKNGQMIKMVPINNKLKKRALDISKKLKLENQDD